MRTPRTTRPAATQIAMKTALGRPTILSLSAVVLDGVALEAAPEADRRVPLEKLVPVVPV